MQGGGGARTRRGLACRPRCPQAAREQVVASRPLVASLVRTLRDMQNEFGLDGGVSVADLVRFPGALERVDGRREPGRRRPRRDVGALLDRALARPRERAAGRGRAAARRAGAGARRDRGAPPSGSRRAAAATREPRARALAGARDAPSSASSGSRTARLYQEAVRAVERHDVSEELQRLRSHATAARELIAGDGGPAGKPPRLPGAGADARGQHGRQQGPGRRRDPRGGRRSRPRSSASASRCRTLSERAPVVVVVSAPSGAGKTTVVGRVLRELGGHALLRVPHHARAARGEREGVDYHFVDRPDFEKLRDEEPPARVRPRCTATTTGPAAAELVRARERGRRPAARPRRARRGAGAPAAARRGHGVHPAAILPGARAAAARARAGRRGDDRAAAGRRGVGSSAPSEHYDYAIVNDDLDACVRRAEVHHSCGAQPCPGGGGAGARDRRDVRQTKEETKTA